MVRAMRRYVDKRGVPREITCAEPGCGAVFVGKGAAHYCPKCRARRTRMGGPKPKYTWTPERDALIRERYFMPGEMAKLVAQWGYPIHAIRQRAARLGVGREKAKPWTPAELALLEERAGIDTPRRLAKRLGRSLRSVMVQSSRLEISLRVREGYTAVDLAACFGVSTTQVARWIRLGLFGAARRRYAGKSAEHDPRDPYRVTEDQVRAFVKTHRTAYSLRTVDQVWFLDIAFDSKRVIGNDKAVA